jgi:hypothetical protein
VLACWPLAGLAAFAFVALLPRHAGAQESLGPEYQAKAQYLLRIARFTDWPANPKPASGNFVIGVLGRDPFGPVLDEAVAGHGISGRPIVVKRFDEPEQIAHVDLLFVADSHRRSIARTLAQLAGAPTLTVADFEGFVGQGGAIELFLEDGRVQFRIDRKAAEAAGLGLRSQLLRAAAEVE